MKQDNNFRSGQIEMKGYPTGNRMSFNATVRRIIIDWGDGVVEEVTPNDVEKTFTHEYTNNNLQTITITTDGVAGFGCSSTSGIYHELRFGDCPNLKEIYCDGNSLTVLDIKKARALELLDCSYNQLTAEALNTTFETLPAVSGHINIRGNPNTSTCNREIAINKGWSVH